MFSKKVELILKERTMNLFNDKWYEDVSFKIEEIFNNDSKGYVYFIKSEHSGYYKIGIAKNIINRLNSLKQTNGSILLIGFVYSENYKDLERSLHLKFKNKNVYGEWFSMDFSVITNELKELKGTEITKRYVSTMIIENGDYLSHDILNNDDVIEKSLFAIIKERIVLNEKYSTQKLFKELQLQNVSQRKFTTTVMKYCEVNGFKYISSRTNSTRFFTIV